MRLWRREEPRLRYYLYISDTKLDMLFEQIDHGTLKRIGAEVKVDLKLASVTLRRADDPAPARAAKLRVVERFIDRHHPVGTIEDPGNEYFRGRMQMEWGWFRTHPASDGDMVVFQGWQGANTVVLAGSGRHVLGSGTLEEEPRSGRSSFAKEILWTLNEHISHAPELADSIRKYRDDNPGWWPERSSVAISYMLNEPFFFPFGITDRRNLTQSLEFLAIPLIQDKSRDSRDPKEFGDADNSVLGTPLYVAIASGPDTTEALTAGTR